MVFTILQGCFSYVNDKNVRKCECTMVCMLHKFILWCELSSLTDTQGEHIQFVQSFKYLIIDVPSTNKWRVCFKSRLQVDGKSHYMLENKCNESVTSG